MKVVLNPKTWPWYARALFLYGFASPLLIAVLFSVDSGYLSTVLWISAPLMAVAVFYAQRKRLPYLIAAPISALLAVYAAIWALVNVVDVESRVSMEEIGRGAYFALGAVLLIYGIIGGGIEFYKQRSRRGQ